MAISSCLVDTNILLRMTRRSDPQHQLVDAALAQLASQRTILHYTHQNIAELWTMTRPLERNGFGLTVADVEREVDQGKVWWARTATGALQSVKFLLDTLHFAKYLYVEDLKCRRNCFESLCMS